MSVPLTPSADKNWITARWACLEESMARSLTVISLLLQSTTHCRYRVYTKFLLTYTAIYRWNRKVLPLGITALQPQSHFHLGTPYIYIKDSLLCTLSISDKLRYNFLGLTVPNLYIFAPIMFVVRNPDIFQTNTSIHSIETRQKMNYLYHQWNFLLPKGCHLFPYKNNQLNATKPIKTSYRYYDFQVWIKKARTSSSLKGITSDHVYVLVVSLMPSGGCASIRSSGCA